jgi:NADH:ubiquinone oxidoreductase subunit 2 (subunit N)
VSLALQLCALAGLPPAVYFFAKLGLLAAVVGCGQVTLVAALAVAIALAWLVYLRAGLTLLQQLTVLPATPLRRTLLPVAAFSLLIFLVCVALVGGFFLDDLGLLAARVSGR